MRLTDEQKQHFADAFGLPYFAAGQHVVLDDTDEKIIDAFYINYIWVAEVFVKSTRTITIATARWSAPTNGEGMRKGLLLIPEIHPIDENMKTIEVKLEDPIRESLSNVNLLPEKGDSVLDSSINPNFSITTYTNNGSAILAYSGSSSEDSIVNLWH